jgi:hypothetical protein
MPERRLPTTIAGITTAVRPRANRFYLALTLLMSAIVLGGFWRYASAVASGHPLPVPRTIHIHALIFAGWMALLLVQVILVGRGRVRQHRRLGSVGLAYAMVIVVMGLAAAIVAPAAHVAAGEWSRDRAAAFVLEPLGDMVLFATFFGGAMLYRRRPEIHKRLIVLATVALLFAPTGRLSTHIGLPAAFGVWVLPVVLGMAHDLFVRGRIHATYLVGTAFMLTVFTRVFIAESEPWLRIGRRVVDLSMPLVAGQSAGQ